MKTYKEFMAVLAEGQEDEYIRLEGLSFVQALYTGYEFIRVPYSVASRTGYATFNTKTYSISDLTGLYEEEFNVTTWEASNNEEFLRNEDIEDY